MRGIDPLARRQLRDRLFDAAALVCPCCKQVIPPKGLFRDQPVKARIYEFIATHPQGVTRRQIMGAVWADDPNGGPEFENVVSVHIKHMRPTLEREGVTISCARGPGATYRVKKLSRSAP
jgi:hypothetical protein